MKRMLLFFATLWLGIMGAGAQGYYYDVNNDGEVNINDAVALVNNILGKENPGDVAVGEAVDLGLPSGTLWASCNIGASKPEEAGDFYSWGENGTKLKYSAATYLFWNNGNYFSLGDDIGGTKYDVARMKWGENWRMPTYAECEELIENCSFGSVDGIEGYKLISRINGNSIFLPAAGFWDYDGIREVGDYVFCWSSTLAPDLDYEGNAYMLVLGDWGSSDYSRYCGLNIRPVRSPKPKDEDLYVDLGLPSGTKWASCNVGATKPEEYGEYFAWGEVGEKKEYSRDTYQFYVNNKWVNLGDDISGTKYDVAHLRWGGNWCMPTLDDLEELYYNCTKKSATLNGINGTKFTSDINGNSIFFPAAGYRWGSKLDEVGSYGSYWLSTVGSSGAYDAYYLYIRQGSLPDWYDTYRYYGFTVRPVYK